MGTHGLDRVPRPRPAPYHPRAAWELRRIVAQRRGDPFRRFHDGAKRCLRADKLRPLFAPSSWRVPSGRAARRAPGRVGDRTLGGSIGVRIMARALARTVPDPSLLDRRRAPGRGAGRRGARTRSGCSPGSRSKALCRLGGVASTGGDGAKARVTTVTFGGWRSQAAGVLRCTGIRPQAPAGLRRGRARASRRRCAVACGSDSRDWRTSRCATSAAKVRDAVCLTPNRARWSCRGVGAR